MPQLIRRLNKRFDYQFLPLSFGITVCIINPLKPSVIIW